MNILESTVVCKYKSVSIDPLFKYDLVVVIRYVIYGKKIFIRYCKYKGKIYLLWEINNKVVVNMDII